MPSFPNIGYQLTDGYTESLPDNLVRSPMDQGEAKVRRRTLSTPYQLSVAYLLTSDDVDALNSFYMDDLGSGALKFTIAHPRTEAQLTCRFTSKPQYTPTEGYYHTMLALEVFP